MIHPALALACLTLWAAAAWAQAPPITGEPQPGRVFCDQSVIYRIPEPATVPEPYRGFLGAWSDAAWDANTCAALIVETIAEGAYGRRKIAPLPRMALLGWLYSVEGATLDWIGNPALPRDTVRELLVKMLGGAMRAVEEVDPAYPAPRPARRET